MPLQDQPEQQQALGVQVVQQQQLVGPSIGEPAEPGAAGEGDEDDDELLGYDDPPGLFDYEAGKQPRLCGQVADRHVRQSSRSSVTARSLLCWHAVQLRRRFLWGSAWWSVECPTR